MEKRFKVGDHVTEQIDKDIWSLQTIAFIATEPTDVDYWTVLGHLDAEELSEIELKHTAPQLDSLIKPFDKENPPWVAKSKDS